MKRPDPPPSPSNPLPNLSRRGFLKGGVATTTAALLGRTLASPELLAAAEPATPPPTASGGVQGLEHVSLKTEVNGKAVALEVHPDESAIQLVRDRLKLTGCKVSCGHGACGACSVHLDGVPVSACLLPATALEGKKLTTVEGIGPTLHPIQRAFMAEDALQCGYCTPGFIMASIAFFESWRASHGKSTPDRDTVASALAGHLCRCGAYPNIYSAVQKACSGAFDAEVGPPPRLEALAKVTGAAKYTVDIQLEGQLVGHILRSPHAHARVTQINTTKAEALKGVAAVHVLTGVGKLVRFAGQEIVAVAAVDAHTVDEALRLIQVEYQVLPAVVTAADARKAGATLVYEKDDRNPANASEGMMLPAKWDGNVRGPSALGALHPKAALKAIEAARTSHPDRLIEGTWTAQVQNHTALEPHACIARWEGNSKLTVWLSTQAVKHMAEDIAERWKLKHADVQVISEHTGGGFGAKNRLGVEGLAAIELARKAGKPVRIALERSEELTVGGSRPGSEVTCTLLLDEKGGLAASEVKGYNDAGVAAGQNTSIFFRLMYPKVDCSFAEYDVLSHAPPGEAFRGPGGPNAFWALEQSVDEAAVKLGVDPLELRRRWDPDSARSPLYDWVQKLPVWQGRGAKSSDSGRFRRGIGLATGCWPYFLQGDTEVELTAGPDGIVASCAVQDMGNGSRSVLAQSIADVLGVPPESIGIRLGNSHYPRGPMSGGSRTTPSIGPAGHDAAVQLQEALVKTAVKKWKLKEARAGKGGVAHAGGLLPWSEILKASPEQRFMGKRRKDKAGYFVPFAVGGINIGKFLGGSAIVVEAEVDTRLGKTRVLRAWSGMNIGHIYVPALARSQAMGAVVQGISYALYEERRLDPATGRNLTVGLEDYRVMGIGDCPEIEVYFHDEPWEGVEGGGIGMAELATVSVPSAVGNAVYHATGWRPHVLPLRPDAVRKGVRS